MTEHIRSLMSVTGASKGIVLTPVASFRWRRRPIKPGEAGIFIDGELVASLPGTNLVLQQAWIDNLGHVEWRDVPTVDA